MKNQFYCLIKYAWVRQFASDALKYHQCKKEDIFLLKRFPRIPPTFPFFTSKRKNIQISCQISCPLPSALSNSYLDDKNRFDMQALQNKYYPNRENLDLQKEPFSLQPFPDVKDYIFLTTKTFWKWKLIPKPTFFLSVPWKVCRVCPACSYHYYRAFLASVSVTSIPQRKGRLIVDCERDSSRGWDNSTVFKSRFGSCDNGQP